MRGAVDVSQVPIATFSLGVIWDAVAQTGAGARTVFVTAEQLRHIPALMARRTNWEFIPGGIAMYGLRVMVK